MSDPDTAGARAASSLQFERLRLAGFKSFADPVEIALLPGLTGIVGPNGCGKSNLTEAMRWAMGEGRAGGVRADAMDEVIFAGARGRPGRTLAEVTIGLARDGEALEITRRIARGVGSTYLLNGREARQRDVQLLFADAATGAHAAALVGQGRIAAVIAAKPTERRQMLEEAAGIAGLAVRRKEAETRLRAAATNLARVEDLGRELDAQVASLRKQARAAERYAELSTRITLAQARLLFAGWRAADARAAQAACRMRAIEAAILAAGEVAAGAERARAHAAAALGQAREGEGTARADLDRARRAVETQAEDRARADRRRRELDTQSNALAADHARETALADEARIGEARARDETGRIAEGTRARAHEAETAALEAEHAAAALPGAEAALADAIDTRARAQADTRAAADALRVAQANHTRRAADLATVARDLAALGDEPPQAPSALQAPSPTDVASPSSRSGGGGGEADGGGRAASTDDAVDRAQAAANSARATLATATQATDSARAQLETTRATLDQARAALDAAQARLAEATAPLAAARAEVAALAAEDTALARADTPARSVPLTVSLGHEAALAAALTDDLDTAVGIAGEGWARLTDAASDPALPPGCEPLARHVRAAPELARRLAQIGLVPDNATGDALAPALQPGQRLVSYDGALWRWDGFDRARPGGAAAARRLAADNRRAELTRLLAPARAALAAHEAQVAARTADQRAAAEQVHAAEATRAAAATHLGNTERARAAAERALSEAEARIARAQAEANAAAARAAEAAERAVAKAAAQAEAAAASARAEAERAHAEAQSRVARRAALEAAHARAIEELATANAEAEAATARAAARPDPAAIEAALAQARAAADQARAAQARAATRLATAQRVIADATHAEAAAHATAASWATRARAAGDRLAELAPRLAALAAELAGIEAAAATADADAYASARATLETAEHTLAIAARTRTEAETALAATEAALATSTEARAAHREARAAASVEAGHADAAREDMRRAALQAHGCEAAALPARFNFEADDAPVDRREAELATLTRDRERLGPVNLRALHELDEAATRATALASERGEVETAIARLRGSIGALNRDGRARLLTTFEGVDRRFRTLFATLFEGGEARLALIDSEDPLDAGLEIYARPPGKAAQSLALLSGGEQALTAVALLFAFFLENPAPICVLDEVDAPLDDANVERFCDLLREVARGTATRFLVVTHNPVTMASMDRLYGVTMAEAGISQLVSVDLNAAEALLAAA